MALRDGISPAATPGLALGIDLQGRKPRWRKGDGETRFTRSRPPRPVRWGKCIGAGRWIHPCGLRRSHLLRRQTADASSARIAGLDKRIRQRIANEIVPALAFPAADAFIARDVEPVAGPCERHVEQAIALRGVARLGGGASALHARSLARAFHRPQKGSATPGGRTACGSAGGRRAAHPISSCTYREKHDRRLQTLSAVHRHDAHLAAPLLHVALDDGIARAASREIPAAIGGEASSYFRANPGTHRWRPPPPVLAARAPPTLSIGIEKCSEELERRHKSARARHRLSFCGRFETRCSSAAANSADQSEPLRPGATAIRSSSFRPKGRS